jgi:hypothetical protein
LVPRAIEATLFLAVLALTGCGTHARTAAITRTVAVTATRQTTTTAATGTGTTLATPTVPSTTARAPGGPRLVVGAVEDEAKFAPTDTAARADLVRAREAGFGAIAFSAFWTPPLAELPPGDLAQLERGVRAAAAESITPIVSVSQFSGHTPLTEAARDEFAAYAASIPRLLPQVKHVIVGNEPNTPLFWMPQFDASGGDAAAEAYERLLARSYDAIKAVSPDVEVIGGALAARGADRPNGKRPTHSPTAFIRDLGAAYRMSGRSRPLVDAFSMHVYGESPRDPPSVAHPHSTTIGIADYDKLERLLREALGRSIPIIYGEYGVNTTIPPDKQGRYSGSEVASKQPVAPRTQAAYYAEAIRMAACQPLVEMLLFFHVTDEPQLEHFQTGVYYADHTPKPGLEDVATAAREAATGDVECVR